MRSRRSSDRGRDRHRGRGRGRVRGPGRETWLVALVELRSGFRAEITHRMDASCRSSVMLSYKKARYLRVLHLGAGTRGERHSSRRSWSRASSGRYEDVRFLDLPRSTRATATFPAQGHDDDHDHDHDDVNVYDGSAWREQDFSCAGETTPTPAASRRSSASQAEKAPR